MNLRISSIKASLTDLHPELLAERLQNDADFKAAYCLTDDLLKIYAEHDLTDLAILGRRNLQEAIAHWRYEMRQTTKQIKKLDRLIEFLTQHATESSLTEYAAKFSGCELDYGRKYDASIDAFAPLDPQAYERPANTSTLQVCGWCKFCRGGWRRGDCKLTCDCKLLPAEGVAPRANLAFDSKCRFLSQLRDDPDIIQARMAELKQQKATLQEQKRGYLKRIAILSELKAAAEDKPLLPCCGSYKDFSEGKRVIVMANLPDRQDPQTGAMPLLCGTVVPSAYQHTHTGSRPRLVYKSFDDYAAHMCAGIQMSNYPVAKLDEPVEDSTIWYIVGNLLSVTEEDFRYLCQHPAYRELWLDSIDSFLPDWVRTTWTEAFKQGIK